MSDPDYTIPIFNAKESFPDKERIEYGYRILNPGAVIGNQYRIVQELGSGGFATTYLAVEIESEAKGKCVVKQLQPRFNNHSIWENAKERFAKEAMVLQWLGIHSQIPQLLAHFEENQQFYLVQEFIEGEEFEQEVHRQVLDETRLISFLCDVLEVLDFVHRQGVIHRDIKPSNLIRRREDGKIALIDFGAVKEIGTLVFDDKQDTVQTQIIGTPGYMPPEQNNGKPVYSSDIYALGKTAIYALTGRSPIEWEDTGIETTNTWQQAVEVSEPLVAILSKMTNPKPLERYYCASEVLEDLKPMLVVGDTIEERYQIISYLGREEGVCSYVVEDLQQQQQSFDEARKPRGCDSNSLGVSNSLVPNSIQGTSSYLLLKLPSINASTRDAVINRLQNELTKLAKLKNYNRIPQILDYFTDEENLYLVQEYITGQNLRQIIQTEFTLSETEAIALLQEVTEILVQIHKQQVVHANIKPSSIIKRSVNGKIILVNLGAIQAITNLVSNGKSGYTPPEQIAGTPTPGSDIYALGMTAIHALTGIAPENLDKNPRTGEVIWQHKARVSPELTNVLNKMVRLAQQQRYHSAAQVLKALKKIQRKAIFKPWHKYIVLSLGGLIVLSFGSYLWLQYEAILLFAQADLQLQSQQYEKAIEYYDAGLTKVRGKVRHFERAWLGKATALSHLKQYEEMLQICERGLQVRQSFYFWNCKGLALEGLEEYERAVAAYNEAIKRMPDFFEATNNRGEAYAKLNKTEKAIADFERAIQISEEKSFVPWNNLGKLYYQQQEYDKSISAYQQAIKVKEDYLPALIGLGNVQISQRLYEPALESYKRAIQINPNSYEAWYGKGLVEEATQNYRAAVNSYERAISLKPNWQAALNALERVEKKIY
ncbi:tetratricopeptide repeat protein [Pleurocapsales cyanobacterium LEGE 06147]|nr:tetratricopeptide repeat protein [Pleurocapsales cyanobacterium LEGE 06147]